MIRTLVTLIILVAVVWYASTCFVGVDQTEFVIVKQFGKPVRTVLEPGLQVKWPLPIQSVERLDNRIQVFEDPAPDAPAKEYLTRDKKNVEVSVYTCWRIECTADAALKFLNTVRDRQGAETSLSDIVKSQLNTRLGSADFDQFVSVDATTRRWSDLVDGMRDVCAQRARVAYGIEILDLRICRFNFPDQNRRSVFDRMRAERERIATQYRSEGEAQAMGIRADAQAEQERILSEAFREAETIRGQADAQATRIYGQAYSAASDFYRFLRTLESYEASIDDDTLLILPADTDYLKLLTEPATAIGDLPELSVPRSLQTTRSDDTEKPGQTDSPEG